MDAKVSVSLLIEKLQDFLLGQAATSNLMFKIQVQKTINNLHSLKIFLKDAEDREASSGFWSMNDQTVARILKAIYSADDATELIRKELQQIRQRENQTSHPFMRSIMSLCSQRHFIHEMKKFKNEVRRLVKQKEKACEDGVEYHNNATRLSSSDNASRIFDFFLDETDEFLGPNKLQMNEFFIKLKPDQFPKVIAVVGEEGLGKTTLATTLYNRVDVKQNFTNRAWIQDASWFDTRHVLVDILRQINQAELAVEATISEYQLMKKIGELLNGGRCLIVLEDVHVERTQILETLLDSSEFDARIIITTRKVIILPSQVAHFTLRLDRLNKKKSWKLFLKKVRVAEKDLNDSKLISLKEKILNICGGLPSAIVLFGGLLSTKKRDYDDWYRVIVRASNNKGDILALSYQDLPSEIKPCFLYMGIFPRKFEIPVRRLIHIWVAEGFVTEKSNPEMMAEKYFEELVIRNMIQVRWKSNGSPKTCCLSGALYDFFSPKAEAVGFFNRQFHSASTTFTKESQLLAVRRLAITYSDIINNFFSLDQVQNLRSYVAFNTQIPDNSDAGMFLKKIISNRGFGLLYVLDLEGVYKPMLTDDVMRKLIHLKYIGLRSTFIDSLPDCVPSLPCLETLDLKHTNISNVIHIDRAEKLQHLYLFVDYSDKVLLDLTSLTNLHTLWGMYFASETELSALQNLTTLTKLKLSCPANVFATNQTAECISHLTNLQSLKLKSVESAADDDHYINMGTLENHQKLQDLNLQGRLSNEMFVIGLFPPYLRKLTLSETRLSEDPMPLLGKLPHLYILCLFSNSSTSSKFTCLSGEFPKLRLLKLWCIQDLQEWIVEEGAMPCLKELEIRYCKKLKDPQGLVNLKFLKKLLVTDMTMSFRQAVEEILRGINDDQSSSKQWGGKKGGEWSYMTNGGIVEIMINHGTYIDSLSFTSVNENYEIENSKKFGGNGGNANRITIDWPEEYLTSISGSVTNYRPNSYVESLTFHTNWYTYGPFGSIKGTPFKFPVEDQIIVGFHGRSGSYMDAIGVVYKKAHPIQVQFMNTVYQGRRMWTTDYGEVLISAYTLSQRN